MPSAGWALPQGLRGWPRREAPWVPRISPATEKAVSAPHPGADLRGVLPQARAREQGMLPTSAAESGCWGEICSRQQGPAPVSHRVFPPISAEQRQFDTRSITQLSKSTCNLVISRKHLIRPGKLRVCLISYRSFHFLFFIQELSFVGIFVLCSFVVSVC